MNLFDLMATLGLDSSSYEKGLGDAEGKANTFGSKLKGGLTAAAKMATAAITATTTAAVGFGVSSVKTGEDFDKAMSQVVATMGYTVEELNDDTSEASKTMQQLRDFAQEMGSTTVFSASQAADALNYMALAGYDAETSMRMLPNVLNLAAAGGIELASASDMITDAQSALGLTLDETTVMVDQMAKTASRSNTSVAQLGEALLTIGGTAQFMAGGTERLNTVLGILADNGIKGSEAGTHLRNMLMKLSSPTKEGADVIEALGLNIFDAEGNMRDMQDIIQDLGAAMEGMSDERKIQNISALFNARDVAAVQALLGTTTERWNELGEAIVDSTGAAQAMADVQLDNLAGDITLFQSALEGAKIAVSDELTPSVREFVQFGSNALGELTTALRTDGLEGVMSALGTIISDGLALLIDKVPDMIKMGLALLEALVQGIIDNLPQLADAAMQIISMIGTAMIDNGPTLITSLGTVLGQILLKLTDPETLGSFIDGIILLVTTMAETFIENIPAIIDAIIQILDNLLQVIRENLPKIVEAAVSIMTSLINGLIEALPKLVAYIPTIINTIMEVITENLPTIIQAAIDIMNALVEGLIEAIPTLVEYLPTILNTIADVIFENLPTIIQAGFDLLEALIDGIMSNLPAIIDAIANIIGRLVEFILQHLPEFIQRGFDIIMALIQGILDNLPAIISTVAQLIVTIIKAIIENLPKILIQGADILMQLIMGLISAIPQLIAAIPQIIRAIIDAFRNTDWGEVGRNILQGIKDGLFSMVGNIVDGVRNIAGRIANGFKNFFGIHSPSKLMRDQVGKMLGLGFAEGIDESAGEAVKSAEDMAKDVLGTMDGIDTELSAGIGDINLSRGGAGSTNGLTATGAGVTINVYGAVGQDVNELAEIISQKIAFTTQRERAAWA